jgi:hypothetical protein
MKFKRIERERWAAMVGRINVHIWRLDNRDTWMVDAWLCDGNDIIERWHCCFAKWCDAAETAERFVAEIQAEAKVRKWKH